MMCTDPVRPRFARVVGASLVDELKHRPHGSMFFNNKGGFVSDILALEVVKSCFYLVVLGLVVVFFRNEIRGLIASLGSFKVAGASFELGDQRTTVASHMILAEILVDVLSNIQSASKISEVLTLPQAEKLGQFAVRYTVAVPKGSWNQEMLRNIAYSLQTVGRNKQALALFDLLLEQQPDHYDFLDQKAYTLMRMGGTANLEVAQVIFKDLCERNPTLVRAHLRLAFTQAGLRKFDDALSTLGAAVHLGLSGDFAKALSWHDFFPIKDAYPQEYAALVLRAEAATAVGAPAIVSPAAALGAAPVLG
jgi:tetratricopeptide (TPR) repeat protein